MEIQWSYYAFYYTGLSGYTAVILLSVSYSYTDNALYGRKEDTPRYVR